MSRKARRGGQRLPIFAPQNAVVDRKTNLPLSVAKQQVLLPNFSNFHRSIFDFSSSRRIRTDERVEMFTKLRYNKKNRVKEIK